MKTIALIDQHTGGHHVLYLKMYTRALIEMGHRVLALCPEPDKIRAYVDNKCRDGQSAFKGYVYRGPVDVRISYWRLRHWLLPLIRWRQLYAVVKQAERDAGIKPDLVFFMYLDDYLYDGPAALRCLIPKIFRYPWAGLYFKPHHLRQAGLNRQAGSSDTVRREYHASGPRTEKQWLQYGESQEITLNAGNCICVGILDEGAAPLLATRLRNPVVTFPDCSIDDDNMPSGEQIVVAGKLPANRKNVVLTGALYSRKGVMDFIQAARATVKNDNFFFLAAGKMDASIRAGYTADELDMIESLISAPHGNLLIINHGVADFDACLRRADILFLAYRDFPFSSNLLFKAAKYRKPVIVSDGYLMAERVHKYNMGIVIEQGDTEQLVSAIRRIAKDREWYRPGPMPDFEGYLTAHSEHNLKKAFDQVVACLPP